MNFVEPIRDISIVKMIAGDLKVQSKRDYMIFMLGIYTGRRIMDILKLKVKELKDKDFINIRENKTGKQIILPVNRGIKKELEDYLGNMQPEEYIFRSNRRHKHIDRTTYYKILKKAAEKHGIENIGCHSMRKTFGYHYYKQSGDVVTLMEIFGHSHPSVTLRYIGINQENINKSMHSFKIF